ncbi:probable phospholipid-transporting ATPase VD isoform X1 [Ictalurus furcatus]|uniref:probable phospholipid-transporting ATPase VD isoform X1 n=1 Tax=Ictalurus furcatus TaxID=66913 RepID=UPI002350E992|nr:probable phospholipid-transporting ATPase VD isoform X1 [Ictalurus furcatus]XP_053476876.1 probable phospholipid-transporting ATPase VD isoform X1 [Ictalurus furcatus]
MEWFHWFRHGRQQVASTESKHGWSSANDSPASKGDLDSRDHSRHRLSGKRRTVVARYGPHRAEYQSISKGYQGNSIRTTKYTVLSFIPMNLFQQFHRAANLYFLFLVLLNWVPVVEAFQKEITMIPLIVVLTVIAFKDAIEDYRRYCYDQRINNNLTHVYSGKQQCYVERRWADVCVGDVVHLCCNEIIPADLVLLHSSDPNGVCHIETANLDGETNLKQRQVVKDLPQQGSEFTPENFSSRIECETPNDDLRRFRGYMEHPDKVRVGLHSENLLLRSCTVRNTETVIGIVVYAGHETKAMQNNSGPRYKRSNLERKLNIDIIWSVVLLLLLCITAAVGHGVWLSSLKDPIFMISDGTHPALAGFYMFWTMIIVLQVLIPISLYVSIEVVKLGQIYFIQNDLDLYDARLDTGIQCRALNITEDLGQIQYLFSDKTGTLTENRMLFRRCTVAGKEYPHNEHAQAMEQYEEQVAGRPERTLALRSSSRKSLSCNRSSLSLNTLTAASDTHSPHSTLHHHVAGAFSSAMECAVIPDVKLHEKLQALSFPQCSSIKYDTADLSQILDFFLALAVCNSVVVSSPSQPRHVVKTPVARTPLRSLEEMKTLLQKLSRPRFSLSPTENSDSPSGNTRKLFSLSRHSHSTPPHIPTHSPSPSSAITPQQQHHTEVLDQDYDEDDKEEDNDDKEEELLYEAESPDEAALVQAARAYGCTLLGRSPEQLLVALPGTGPLTVPLLHLLPFHSARKRMSVVVRHPLTSQVVLYTKGADSVIMELAGTSDNGDNSREIMMRTQRHLNDYAKEGLRTLCVAKRVLQEAEYKAWLTEHTVAETSIENREELLLESAQRLETNLTLLGATGIVDRLQEDVPETIEALQKAGIKVWVLTGDKQETAINIACACKLLQATDQLLTANCDSKEACEARLLELQQEIKVAKDKGLSDFDVAMSQDDAGISGFTLVIDGRTLDFALQKELQKVFLDVTVSCRSVICCRSTPLQKSQVVRLVGDSLGVMTLAIGDGANDVSMIQVADVGVGISGQEGMQAVMSSDFAISRFKYLRKLLLVHGHWCYTRLANMILYFFYKNVMFVNLLFWFQLFCGFSGSTMSNSWVLIFFNLLFTSIPPLLYGVLDKDVSSDTLLSLPQLYKAGQNSQAYLPSTFWLNMVDAFYQSLVCFFIPYCTYAGSDIDLFSFGSPINGSALLIILLHQVIESHTLTWLHAVVLLGSGIFYYAFVLVFSVTCVTCNSPTNPFGIETRLMSESLYYCVCGLTTVLALLPRVFYHALSNSLCPSDLVKAQKLDKSFTGQRWSSMHHWEEDKSAKEKLNSRPIPQTLSVNADMPHFANCSSEIGPVPS